MWFLKIGAVSLGPAALHSQLKKNGMLKPQEMKGKHRKVVKLMCRDLGSMLNETRVKKSKKTDLNHHEKVMKMMKKLKKKR